MTAPADYALLATASYGDVRQGRYLPSSGIDTDNDAPLPEGWVELTAFRVDGSGGGVTSLLTSGFSARVYRNTGTQEIIISYGGTKGDVSWGTVADFIAGNIPLASGNASSQAALAAELYQKVKAQHGGDAISLTGHSLGGGLASLMAVYFDRPAYVFAPAPFQASADATLDGLQQMMIGALVSAKRYLTSRMGEIDAALASYDPARDYAAREANVTSWTSKGEVLEASLGMFKWIEGATNRLFASSAITPVHFFELADQRVEVTMVASAEETERLFAHLREHRVHVFYARTPVEFGTIGEGDAQAGRSRFSITRLVATEEKSTGRCPLLLTTGRVPTQYNVREEIAANRDKPVSMAGR